MQSKIRCYALAITLGILSLLRITSALADLTVDQVFNQRELRGPSSLYGPASDWIVFGAIDVLPNGDAGTTGVFEQLNTTTNTLVTGPMVFTPFSAFPNAFGGNTPPYEPGLSGSWKLTFSNGGQSVEVFTPSIGTAPPPAPPLGLKISGISTATPTLSWSYPAGSTATSSSVTIYDGTNADIIHVAPLGNTAQTSYNVPAVLSSGKTLEFGHPYTFSVELNDNRPDGSYRARGFSFVDFVLNQGSTGTNLYLPQTVPDGNFPAGGYYQFTGVPVQAGVPVNLDPDIATGYVFDIGAGDPKIKSVTLPGGIGDGKYDLYILVNGIWTLLAKDVLAGTAFTFSGDGVAKFRVEGIEKSAGLDPGDPTAFVTTLAFETDGTFNGRMIPLTEPIPEPYAYVLLAAGLAIVGFTVRRRRS
jgi:hypothetical protein